MASTNLDAVSVEIKVAGKVCDYVTMELFSVGQYTSPFQNQSELPSGQTKRVGYRSRCDIQATG